MYKDLIKALRSCDVPRSYYFCAKCFLHTKHGGSCGGKALLSCAAEAIEKLASPAMLQVKGNLTDDERKRLVELLDRNFGYVEEEPADIVADRLIEAGFVRPAETMKWISAEEQLPGPYEVVLISILTTNGLGEPSRLETLASMEHVKWIVIPGCGLADGERITHWMPLPAPPKEDRNG